MPPTVTIIMGSKSDMPVAERAAAVLEELKVGYDMCVASAHRTPEWLKRSVEDSTASVFIAVAGLSAALPGAVAALTHRPVVGVPVSGKVNMDSILSIVQMPPGVPVAAVGLDRGDNAAILAAEILALGDAGLSGRLGEMRERKASAVVQDSKDLVMARGRGR